MTIGKNLARDGTEFVIREPTEADAKSMMRYINSVIREKRSGIIMDRPMTLKQETEWLKARLEEIRKRMTVMLVAEADGRVLGNCHVARHPWKEKHRAAIGIALIKEARGKGIGRVLMQDTMDLSERRMRGLEMFDLSVLEYNDRAQSLYGSLGFAEVGRIPRSMKEDGEYADEWIMVRFIVKNRRPKAARRGKGGGR